MFISYALAPVLFWIAVVISIIVIWFRPSIGVLSLALVGYLGINWSMWSWVSWTFWIFWVFGLVTLVVHYRTYELTENRYARYTKYSSTVAPWGARAALSIVLIMALLSVLRHFGWLPAHFHLNWWWLFWLLVVAAIVALVFGLVRHMAAVAVMALVALLVLALVGGGVNLFGGRHDNRVAGATPTVTVTTTISPPPVTPKPTATAACPDTWQIKTANHNNNRWFANGVQSIRDAKTPAQARAAATDWVHRVESDPVNLSGAVSYFLDKNVPPAQLVNGKCASEQAKSLAAQLELAVATAKVTPDHAPSNGTNSGVDNGKVVSATAPGITGDTRAIKVELANGKVVWVMWRCGNAVKKGKAPVPPGHTEHQPPASPPHSTPPGHTSQCKANEHVSPQDHHTCIVNKVASQNILRNSTVNSQVKGEGKTPVGTSPGPATRPTDGGTGCGGPCPGHSATSSSTPSSSPTATITPRTSTPTTPAPITSSPTASGTITGHGP